MDEKKNTTSEDIDSEMAKAYWKKHMYIEGLPDNIEAFRELLEGYSKVPPAEIDALLLQTVSFASQNAPCLIAPFTDMCYSATSFGRW